MKSYAEILKEIRDANPKLSFRDSQIEASIQFKKQQDLNGGYIAPVIANKIVSASMINPDEVEAKIRAAGVDRNSIQVIAKNFSPDFVFNTDGGKDGVNTLCYLTGVCRVPRNGFFKVYI